MRAVELPSPAAVRRRLSPLPVTLAALIGLLALKLAAVSPDLAPTPRALADARPFADVLPAAAPSTPTPSSPGDGDATAEPAPDTAPTSAERRGETERLIDEVIAPAAGDAEPAAADAGPRRPSPPPAQPPDPLAAEPFLEERRALARQREALGVRKLAVEVAEERLEELVAELSALKQEVDTKLAELEASDEARLARLVNLYEKMRPKDAARIFDDLDFDVLVPLALAMNERKLAPIVAAMQPAVARELTAEVAEQRGVAKLEAALADAQP